MLSILRKEAFFIYIYRERTINDEYILLPCVILYNRASTDKAKGVWTTMRFITFLTELLPGDFHVYGENSSSERGTRSCLLILKPY